VQVDHRRARAGVPHSLHQLPQAGTVVGGKLVPRVPEIVEVNRPDLRVGERLDPDLAEVLTPEFAALWPDEHAAVLPWLGVLG
jgi:hypothetical protein